MKGKYYLYKSSLRIIMRNHNRFVALILIGSILSFDIFAATPFDMAYQSYNKILKKIEYEINNKKNKVIGFRPKSCPLNSVQFKGLAEKLKSISNSLENNSKCTAGVQGTLKNIDSAISEINRIEKDQREQDDLRHQGYSSRLSEEEKKKYTSSHEIAQYEAAQRERKMELVQNSLKNFSNVAENAECQKALTASSGMSMAGDVVFGASGLGMLYPGPEGFAAAMGGQMIGALFKIISVLLTPIWDFSKQEDRETFIKINCAFFDVKSDLEKVGLLENRSDSTEMELRFLESMRLEISNQIASLQKYLDNLKTNRNLKNKIKILGKFSMDGKDGLLTYQLFNLINESRTFINTEALFARSSNQRVKSIEKLFDFYQDISKILFQNNQKIQMGRVERVRDLPLTLKEFPRVLKGANTKDKLWQIVMPNRATEIQDYEKYIKDFLRPIEWLESNLQELANNASNIGFRELVQSNEIKIMVLLSRFETLDEGLKGRETFLRNLSRGAVFSEADNGAAIKANILLEYNHIQDAIYGKIGRDFLDYIGKNASTHINDFNKRIKNVEGQLSSIDRNLCPDVLKVRYSYITSTALTNLGFDFLMANKDSFYAPGKSRFLVFSKGWSQNRIKEHYDSSVGAKKLILQHKGQLPPGLKNPFKETFYTPIGSDIFRITQALPNLRQVQNFISKNGCSKSKVDAQDDIPNWMDTN